MKEFKCKVILIKLYYIFQVVQCHVKKIRLDMLGPNQRQEETNEQDQPVVRDEQEEGEQEVERLDLKRYNLKQGK